jgi:mono/diheme cytochrome c family protein
MRARLGCQLTTLVAILLLQSLLFGQTASQKVSVKDGVFTAEQAERGNAIYQSKCVMCHGNALEGRGLNSPLAGAAFLNKWDGQTVSDLFMKTIVMMPAMDPGTMKPKETADVIAYILSVNKFPAGKTELPSVPQPLEMIRIVKP